MSRSDAIDAADAQGRFLDENEYQAVAGRFQQAIVDLKAAKELAE